MKGFVSKDLEDGRLFAWDGGRFSAIFVDGVWSEGTFSADDFKDNFNRVLDEAEAARILDEARAALSV